MKYEKISALVDGELEEGELGPAVEALRLPEAQARLDLYYQIGDVLNAEAAKAEPGPEFAQRMRTLLDAEPPHSDGEAVSDVEKVQLQLQEMALQQLEESAKPPDEGDKKLQTLKQLALPGIAAIAAVAVVMSPQFMFIIQTSAPTVSHASLAGATLIAQNLLVC